MKEGLSISLVEGPNPSRKSLLSISEFSITNYGDSMDLKLALDRTVPRSIISISNSTLYPILGADQDPLIEWPIQIRYYSFTPHDAGLLKPARSVSRSMSLASKGTLILLAVDSKAGNQLRKFFTNAMYQAAIGGPEVLLPDTLLKGLKDTYLVPFKVDHLLEGWMHKDRACEPHPILQTNEIACDFLENYSEDTTVICSVLICSSIISLVHYFLSTRKKKILLAQVMDRSPQINYSRDTSQIPNERSAPKGYAEQSLFSRIVRAINQRLGLRYFTVLLDGSQLEIISLFLINLSHLSWTPQTLAGLMIGLVGAVYYFAVSIRILRLAKPVYFSIQPTDPASLDEILQRKNFEILGILFEGYGKPRSKTALLKPVFEMLRSLLISLSVFLLLSHPWGQVVLAFLIECGMLWVLLKTRVRQSRLHNFVESLVCVLNIM